MSKPVGRATAVILIALVTAAGWWLGAPALLRQVAGTPTATATAEPLLPTRTPSPVVISTPVPFVAVKESPPSTSEQAPVRYGLWQGQPRWGIGVAELPLTKARSQQLQVGWYLDWGVGRLTEPDVPATYAPMVRMTDGKLRPPADRLGAFAREHRGSLWLIGNEPDVRWQDDATPDEYVRLFHEAVSTIKGADPSAQIAIGGISQPTPLRLRYLDAVLAAYRAQFGVEIPVDVWNFHNFILREERDSWGVDIPPGFPDPQGKLYEISDNARVDVFRQQVVAFRTWMAENGLRQHPLILSEYGIPMPPDYGFPEETVQAFLRTTFDYLGSATDELIGYPADNNRLVQRWCWFSLGDPGYITGNLYDAKTSTLTHLGSYWSQLVATR
jgi:hypothetical protein